MNTGQLEKYLSDVEEFLQERYDQATPGSGTEPEVRILKCLCGHPGCRYYWISDGKFVQGSGWDTKKHAKAYASLMNAAPELLRRYRAMRRALRAVNELMQSSRGVSGLPGSTGVVPWNTLLKGGENDSWLEALNEVRDTL